MTLNCYRDSNVWETISEKVKDIHGWSPIDQLFSLFMLTMQTKYLNGDIIEVGAWGGRSAVALGLAAREISNSKVYSIDYFPNAEDWKENSDGTFSFKTEVNGKIISGHKEQTVWKEPFENSIKPFYEEHPNLFKYFSSNIENCGLQGTVIPFKGNSNSFKEAAEKKFRCKLLYIDGEHSYESVERDIKNLKDFIVSNGVICFDDAFSGYEGVDRAIEKLIIASGEFHSFMKLTRKLFVAIKK